MKSTLAASGEICSPKIVRWKAALPTTLARLSHVGYQAMTRLLWTVVLACLLILAQIPRFRRMLDEIAAER